MKNGLRDTTLDGGLTNGGYKMPEATINHLWRGAGWWGFSVTAAAAAVVAGFLVASLASLASLILIIWLAIHLPVPQLGVPLLLVLSIAWTLWLFAGRAAAEDGWPGAAKRISFLLTATAAAVVAGIFLAALIVCALIVGYEVTDGGYGGSRLLLLVIPLLLALSVVAVAASVWLARRSRISRPWFPWFLIGAGAIVLAYGPLFVLALASSGD
jgi:hypothetical protein